MVLSVTPKCHGDCGYEFDCRNRALIKMPFIGRALARRMAVAPYFIYLIHSEEVEQCSNILESLEFHRH